MTWCSVCTMRCVSARQRIDMSDVAGLGKTALPSEFSKTMVDSRGQAVDEIGGETTAGRVEKASVFGREGYLPFALARGSLVLRDIPAGTYLRYTDVEPEDPDALLLQLRQFQCAHPHTLRPSAHPARCAARCGICGCELRTPDRPYG